MNHNPNNFPKRPNKKKDKAYFASKSELLTWVSTTLDLEIKSIEETQTGAIFCQLLDAAHPGTVRLNKVNWKAKLETEYISNFKLFQQGLSNNNIEKPINIQRLSKGKSQELIELLQWLYGHHLSLGIEPNNYDAIKKRNGNNFVYYGQKLNNGNYNRNNLNLRDDMSKSSANSDNKDFFGIKNQLKNKNNIRSNINSLNANLRSSNYLTKFNNNNNFNVDNRNKRGKSEKISINSSNRSISNISMSSINQNMKENFSNNKYNSNNKNIELENKNQNVINMDGMLNTPFIIEEKPEEDEKLNSILFDGISNVDKENILELEKHDGNNIRDLKILIRKLRINNIIFKSNLGSILNKVTKERDFYLNKLKDIEYLYFNPIIRNDNENKNGLLKSILSSEGDSTIIINKEGIASIKPINNHYFPLLKNNDDVNDNIINTKRNSQNVMRIQLAYSKNNKNDKIILENKYNKTQPILSESNRKKIESNIFPLKNNYDTINRRRNNNENNINNNNHVTPSTKTAYYDISSHILNESLHIPNTENSHPNIINDVDLE